MSDTASAIIAPALGRRGLDRKYLPLTITISLFVLMYGVGSVIYPSFFSPQVFLNLFIDNAFLGIVAIGMTFVIVSGGIDLSVGSVIALTTMIAAALLQAQVNPALVILVCLLAGAALGAFHGWLVAFFDVPPFIATLGGMFLARGLCYVISINSIEITDETFAAIAQFRISLPGDSFISINVLIFAGVALAAIVLAHYTRLGRSVYALGGNEQSALLMGLPVRGVKVFVYLLSGVCSAIAGIVFSFYMLSGYALHCRGLELDAIAAAVIGGTLLTGGVGYVAGTIFGTLILGVIQTFIAFQGDLSSWWTKIFIGFLIFFFIFMQTLLGKGGATPAQGDRSRPSSARRPGRSADDLPNRVRSGRP